MKGAENQILVIFGASGDLTKRKLIPALYSLEIQGLLPEKFAIIGVSRSPMTDDLFRESLKTGVNEFSDEKNQERINEFLQKVYYQSIDAQDADSFIDLKEKLAGLQNSLNIQ